MKTITWGGAALVGVIGVAALVANAAVGDVVYLRVGAFFDLTTGQKTALSNWIVTAIPDYQPADLQQIGCVRRANSQVWCNGIDKKTMSESDYADAEIAGDAPEIDSIGGGNVTFVRNLAPTQVTGASLVTLGNMTSTACGVADPSTLVAFTCERVFADVRCRCEWLQTDTPENYVAAKQAGDAIRAVGRVE